MARLPDLLAFSEQHGLRIGTIADLIHYRSAHESLVERVARRRVRTVAGPFDLVVYRDKPTAQPHLALVAGEPAANREVLVRVHEPLSPLDLLISDGTAHSWSIDRALRAIADRGEGVLVMLNCAQDSTALFGQLRDWCAIQGEADRVERLPRGEAMDLRTYGIGAQILRDLGVTSVRLLTNNPDKTTALEAYGIKVTERLPLVVAPTVDSLRYLQTKAERMGHDLPGLEQS